MRVTEKRPSPDAVATPMFMHSRSRFALIAALGLSGCGIIKTTCPGPEGRYVASSSRTGDVSGSLQVDVRIQAQEERGGSGPATSVFVRVSAFPLPASLVPDPVLMGHVKYARLQRADGTLLLRLPLVPQSSSLGEIGSGYAASPAEFEQVKSALLGNDVVIVLETDASVPALEAARVVTHEYHDWAGESSCG